MEPSAFRGSVAQAVGEEIPGRRFADCSKGFPIMSAKPNRVELSYGSLNSKSTVVLQ